MGLLGGQPESARQIHDARPRCQRARRQGNRNLSRRAQENHVHHVQVGHALFVAMTGQVRGRCGHSQAITQELAGPLVAGHQAE